MSSSNEQQILLFRSQLLEEQPKVDSALKSFASLQVAKATANQRPQIFETEASENSFESWNLMECLQVTRHVSKHMNQHIVAIGGLQPKARTRSNRNEMPLDLKIAQQVWNELVASKQKPTKLLGRTALRLIWDDLDLENALLAQHNNNNNSRIHPDSNGTPGSTSDHDDDEEDDSWRNRVTSYVRQFHALLIRNDEGEDGAKTTSPGDAALLWHADRGASELARRAAERHARAAQQSETAAATTTTNIP